MSGGLRRVFEAQQRAFSAERYPSLATRQRRLDRIGTLIGRHEHEIVAAISEDFGTRPTQETRLTELFVVLATLRHARRHLARWMRPRRARTPLYLRPGKSRIERQPLGVVGVVSPWNYPLQLALVPAVAALAAGNRVMVKPSERTPRMSALLEALVGRHFDPGELAVVTGGPDVGAEFAKLPFDHLLFTGSTAVGRSVALAAAENLTPLTLELGGKSPALILDHADLPALAPRLAVGKLLNAGQTCIAPDYVLVPERVAGELADALAQAVAKLYPSPRGNADYAGIVDERHHGRLIAMVDDARRKGAKVIELGGDAASPASGVRRLPPTLILEPSDDMAVMQQEIFGPILPIETYAALDQAIARINARPRPLAMYLFGGDQPTRRRVLADTVAGGVTVDDTLWHFCNEHLPFGGVGASGYGAYHGERGFLAFSHQKPIFIRSRMSLAPLLYPPYGRRFESMLKVLRKVA
ncbi:MAG TPA: coniferyl aldehyde dehydrogenase [Casimicrobiaceae bacterium]|nr:coniferyl aldehyde dehydrogenase [Casimicrobiaceae bacterium]